MGSVRAIEPGAMTRMSYETSRDSPSSGTKVAVRLAWSTAEIEPDSTWHLGSTLRSGTTTWRGSRLPAAASGRNGW